MGLVFVVAELFLVVVAQVLFQLSYAQGLLLDTEVVSGLQVLYSLSFPDKLPLSVDMATSTLTADGGHNDLASCPDTINTCYSTLFASTVRPSPALVSSKSSDRATTR